MAFLTSLGSVLSGGLTGPCQLCTACDMAGSGIKSAATDAPFVSDRYALYAYDLSLLAERNIARCLPALKRVGREVARLDSRFGGSTSEEAFLGDARGFLSLWSSLMQSEVTVDNGRLLVAIQHFVVQDMSDLATQTRFSDSFDSRFGLNSQLWKDLPRDSYQICGRGFRLPENGDVRQLELDFGCAFMSTVNTYCEVALLPSTSLARRDMLVDQLRKAVSTEMSQVALAHFQRASVLTKGYLCDTASSCDQDLQFKLSFWPPRNGADAAAASEDPQGLLLSVDFIKTNFLACEAPVAASPAPPAPRTVVAPSPEMHPRGEWPGFAASPTVELLEARGAAGCGFGCMSHTFSATRPRAPPGHTDVAAFRTRERSTGTPQSGLREASGVQVQECADTSFLHYHMQLLFRFSQESPQRLEVVTVAATERAELHPAPPPPRHLDVPGATLEEPKKQEEQLTAANSRLNSAEELDDLLTKQTVSL